MEGLMIFVQYTSKKEILLRFVLQSFPVYHMRHVHLKPSGVLMQLPPFWQGFEEQKSVWNTNTKEDQR